MASQNVLVILATLVTASPGAINDRTVPANPAPFQVIRIGAPETVPASPSPRQVASATPRDHLPPVEITGPEH